MINTVSSPPNIVPMAPPRPRWLNSAAPRKPPASPVNNGWRWKKLGWAAPAAPAAGPTPEGRAAVVALGLTLRVIGAASLCSKVRDPRLPIPGAPDDVPPLEYDLPARASARLGASTSAKAKNSASKADQSRGGAKTGDRVDMARSVREPMEISASQYGDGPAAPPRTIDLKGPYLQG